MKKPTITHNEILENLCYHDGRNPDYTGPSAEADGCYCDNCFQGKTELAEQLLRYENQVYYLTIEATR